MAERGVVVGTPEYGEERGKIRRVVCDMVGLLQMRVVQTHGIHKP